MIGGPFTFLIMDIFLNNFSINLCLKLNRDIQFFNWYFSWKKVKVFFDRKDWKWNIGGGGGEGLIERKRKIAYFVIKLLGSFVIQE